MFSLLTCLLATLAAELLIVLKVKDKDSLFWEVVSELAHHSFSLLFVNDGQCLLEYILYFFYIYLSYVTVWISSI